jgi:hypothetical protein
MGLQLLYGKTEAQLLALLSTFQDEWLEVSRVVEAGGGDVSSKTMLQSIEERIWTVQRSLYQLNPDDYPEFEFIGESQTKVGF